MKYKVCFFVVVSIFLFSNIEIFSQVSPLTITPIPSNSGKVYSLHHSAPPLTARYVEIKIDTSDEEDLTLLLDERLILQDDPQEVSYVLDFSSGGVEVVPLIPIIVTLYFYDQNNEILEESAISIQLIPALDFLNRDLAKPNLVNSGPLFLSKASTYDSSNQETALQFSTRYKQENNVLQKNIIAQLKEAILDYKSENTILLITGITYDTENSFNAYTRVFNKVNLLKDKINAEIAKADNFAEKPIIRADAQLVNQVKDAQYIDYDRITIWITNSRDDIEDIESRHSVQSIKYLKNAYKNLTEDYNNFCTKLQDTLVALRKKKTENSYKIQNTIDLLERNYKTHQENIEQLEMLNAMMYKWKNNKENFERIKESVDPPLFKEKTSETSNLLSDTESVDDDLVLLTTNLQKTQQSYSSKINELSKRYSKENEKKVDKILQSNNSLLSTLNSYSVDIENIISIYYYALTQSNENEIDGEQVQNIPVTVENYKKSQKNIEEVLSQLASINAQFIYNKNASTNSMNSTSLLHLQSMLDKKHTIIQNLVSVVDDQVLETIERTKDISSQAIDKKETLSNRFDIIDLWLQTARFPLLVDAIIFTELDTEYATTIGELKNNKKLFDEYIKKPAPIVYTSISISKELLQAEETSSIEEERVFEANVIYKNSNINYILGVSTLSKPQIIQYIQSNMHASAKFTIDYLTRLVHFYFEEAEIEGVNPEVAITQILASTNMLEHTRLFNKNNPADISTKNGGSTHSFATLQVGIRAHIQHLKAYASKEPLGKAIVDPRNSILHEFNLIGTVQTVDKLAGSWYNLTNSGIPARMQQILNNMHSLSS